MIKAAVAAIGGLILIGLVAWFGGREIGAEVWQAGWAIPINIVIHLLQLASAACAWRLLVGERQFSPATYIRFRLVREGVNSLLPVAQIGGSLVGIRLMVKAGISGALAGAGTTLDLTVEGAMQLVFTLAGLGLLGAEGADAAWAHWVEGGVGLGALALLGFIAAQRAGLMHLIEGLFNRLQKYFPGLSRDMLQGLHQELLRLQKERWALAQAAGFHFASWAGGTFEIYVGLLAMGHEVSLRQAFVIESLGMAARSAGFAVPGALGVQEGGFILVCGLFGIAPDMGLALSMLKRLREIIVGSAGLLIWQWHEWARWLKRETRMIYHVCKKAEWEAALAAGRYVGSSQDQADGFIHFSGPKQVEASVAKHRAGQDGLVLVACDETKMAPGLKWEVSRGGALFPHHYGDLPLAAVVSVRDLPLGPAGTHLFPEEL